MFRNAVHDGFIGWVVGVIVSVEFGIIAFVAIIFFHAYIRPVANSFMRINWDTFSVFNVHELLLFFLLFSAILYFFGPVKKSNELREVNTNKDVKLLFVKNIASIFISYGALIMINLMVFT